MKTVDISNWGEILVSDLFEHIERGKGSGAGSFFDGETPYIAASFANNGYVRDVDDADGTLTSDGNCIAMIVNGNGGVGRNTYQAEPFVGSSDLQLGYHHKLNQWNGLFLVACLNKSIERYNYSFAWKRTGEAFARETVFLPVLADGSPDWDDMEHVMRSVMEEQGSKLELLRCAVITERTPVNIEGWGLFQLTELFDIKNTKSITAAKLIPDSGTTPYVTAQDGNNGVQTYVSCPDTWLDEGDCILIGGKTLTFSYQAADFCSNDSHNIALYSKSAKAQKLLVQLYLLSVLRVSLTPLFSWGDSISKRRTADLAIRLPVDTIGAPDWDYMESTMKSLMEQKAADLDVIQQLLPQSEVQEVV